MTKNLSEFYDLSELVEDDLKIVSLLVSLESLEVSKKVLNDLQTTKLDKYDFNRLLGLKIGTIRDLSNFFKVNVDNFKIKEDLKVVSNSDTNLLSFIGDE